MDWKNISVLITGGTGSFGRKFTEIMLRDCRPKKLIVFSRDELKQHEMREIFPDSDSSPMRYFIGDVRDQDRLFRAFHGVDVVIHAAALKQVPACEYNPFEAVQTNIIGAKNIIDASIDQGVKRIIAISTDKAANPVNLYGATKLCAEKIVIQANSYAGQGGSRFSCVRYGNVIGSRGSVVPVFLNQKKTGQITITDERMSRFWISLEQGVRFVIKCVELMEGGEIFIPKIPSMRVVDLADTIAPECSRKIVGVRPGEKVNEILITEDESRHTVELDDFFVIEPEYPWWSNNRWQKGKKLAEGFRYTSDNNTQWLSKEELKKIIG